MKSWYEFNRNSFAVAIGLSLLTAIGCGGGGAPALGQVDGTVTLGGKPLVDAMVYFAPEAGGRSSSAMTNSSGQYVLLFNNDSKGAIVGKHKVVITTFEAGEQSDDGKKMVGGSPELVPRKYNAESTLVQEVKKGKQTIDFALEP